MRTPIKIFVTGTRGIPDIPGGVEKHCQELYPLVAKSGVKVWLATRTPYTANKAKTWKHINLVHIYAPSIKSLEAIWHTAIALFRAKMLGVDLVHIHTIGPALLVPLAKILGLTVVITHHGPDYERLKWGRLARFMLRLGEYLGGRFADEVIVISDLIRDRVKQRCKKKSHLIYNGVPRAAPSRQTDYIEKLGLCPGQYILAVSRFVPEKAGDLLLEAYEDLKTPYKLVMAGDADHETPYSRNLKKKMDINPQILRPGYVTGNPLTQLYSHAAVFVLPSYHEGLPIALLEAMSYGIKTVVSDIPANLEVGLPRTCYFKSGDRKDLSRRLGAALEAPISEAEKLKFKEKIRTRYDWKTIADQTVAVYLKTMASKN